MKLYLFGSNTGSQLGEEIDREDTHIPTMHPFFNEKNVEKLACGIMHTLVLIEGKVFSWGCNDELALGRDGEEHKILEVVIKERVIDVSAGVSHSACLTESGKVYAWGTFRNGYGIVGFSPGVKLQKKPKLIERGIAGIASCDNHISMVRATGSVLGYGPSLLMTSTGSNKKSKTALRSRIIMRGAKSRPKMEKIVGGADHCLGIANGRVYAWGNNSQGQFGNGTTTNSHEIRETGMTGVNDIGAGSIHSAFLKGEDLYVCGTNEFHQLGDTLKMELEPVKFMSGVQMISCKASGNLAVKKDGIYAWGSNFSGELGFPEGDVVMPKLVDFDFGEIVSVGLGNDHCVVISK